MIAQPAAYTLDQFIAAERADDLRRVTTDIANERLDPNNYDCPAIAAEMRKLAGIQPLDKVPDDAWSDLLKWHLRAPMPVEVAQ